MAGDSETPLLLETVDGVVDFKDRPALRSKSGGWKAAAFIISKSKSSNVDSFISNLI